MIETWWVVLTLCTAGAGPLPVCHERLFDRPMRTAETCVILAGQALWPIYHQEGYRCVPGQRPDLTPLTLIVPGRWA